MVNQLYYVIDIVFVIVLLTILHHEKKLGKREGRVSKPFRLLIRWVIFFCAQDAVWGIIATEVKGTDWPLFVASAVFHLSTVLATFFWLYYVLSYLGERVRHPRLLLLVDGCLMLVQLGLVVTNFFHPVIYRIEDGAYVTESLRPLAFFNQYIAYLAIGLMTGVSTLSVGGPRREKYRVVFFFSIAPVLTGVVQLLYPNDPYYSMGYFLGCFIIYIYIVSADRHALIKNQARRELHRQEVISNTDALTGMQNRRAFELYIMSPAAQNDNDHFAFLSIDINGLKQVNDNKGHEAGDELICGAAACMKKCLGPYGQLFRIGGDEFAAAIYASGDELKRIERDLEEHATNWQGKLVESLSISLGVVSRAEFRAVTLKEMVRMADERMYAAKERYYSQRGMDRRGMMRAYSALCSSYTKILKINVTDDTHKVIFMDNNERMDSMGFSDSISRWLHDFGTSGQVHPDDLGQYLELTDRRHLIQYFGEEQHTCLNIFYRRKSADGYRLTKMEMLPADDFGEGCLSLYLYVKDIDK